VLKRTGLIASCSSFLSRRNLSYSYIGLAQTPVLPTQFGVP
jgi:hypothetical protein